MYPIVEHPFKLILVTDNVNILAALQFEYFGEDFKEVFTGVKVSAGMPILIVC